MRKQTKIAVLVSAAALLTMGAAMTSFAAWEPQADGGYRYTDRDGYYVTETWEKSGSYWYWLDADGYMATNTLVEDDDNRYWVDENGVMKTNGWVAVPNEDYDAGDDEADEYSWYYFQNNGKAYKQNGNTVWRTINGKKYAFGSDGKMLYGWIDINGDSVSMYKPDEEDAYQKGDYYCGGLDDGARRQGQWERLYVGDNGPANKDDPNDDSCAWFYFQASGKKHKADDKEGVAVDAAVKKIGAYKYAFDVYGMMMSGWVDGDATPASTSTGNFRTDANGAMRTGWFKEVPWENLDSGAYADDSAKWFYANTDGTLKHDVLFTKGGKKYAFGENGEMLTGLKALKVYADDNNRIEQYMNTAGTKVQGLDTLKNIDDAIAAGFSIYYFGGSDDGAMKTGSQNVEVNGETYQFVFDKSGETKGQGTNKLDGGLTNPKAVYVGGRKLKADVDYRYMAVKIVDGKAAGEPVSAATLMRNEDYKNSAYVVINTSGTVQKSGEKKDSDGIIFVVDKETHIITEVKVNNK